ncbi:MAG: MexH family multidrug efflux RND transporter periplasmic adaptor subunit [Nitrospirales bacterium]|nr:MAG: MexH family multidrug efflux RND transporter periplasmic adaptor subunit [Nitrospirales bacterium]
MNLKNRFQNVRASLQTLEENDWWIKIRKLVVTGMLLVVIYYSANSVAAYLSAPRLDMTMSPLAGAVAVAVVAAERREMVSTVTYTGTVIPKSVVKVFPRIEGWLEEILIDVGDVVKKGQVLIRLDKQELLTTRAERQAHRVFTRREFQRDARLVKEGAIAQSEADRSRMMFEEARAKAQQINTLLSYTEVTSPIDGLVTDRVKLINPGELVHPTTHLLDLADTKQMRVQVKVAEKDLPHIHVGTKTTVRLPSLPVPDHTILAEVSTVFPQLDSRTRTSTVEILVENPKGLIRADMYAIVDLVLAHKADALAVPRQAILQVDGESVVFTTDTVVAMKQPVRLGMSSHDMVEVVEGINEGDLVITKGARGLTDFQEVAVVSGF